MEVTPSSKGRAGIWSSFKFKVVHTKTALFKTAQNITFSNGYNKLTCAETSQVDPGDTRDQYYIL